MSQEGPRLQMNILKKAVYLLKQQQTLILRTNIDIAKVLNTLSHNLTAKFISQIAMNQ